MVTVQITDPRYPRGFYDKLRLIDFTVTPGDNGEESIKVTLEQVYNG
jgi:hypothetical protein